jgi:Zn-dependent protease with chaperone function
MLAAMRVNASALLGVVFLLSLSACASTVRLAVRPPTEAEMQTLREAITPLAEGIGPELTGGCPIGLVVIKSRAINAGVQPSDGAQRCPRFTLAVTEGMLQRLSLPMMRAILAHELGHVQLGHMERRRERGATAALWRPFTAAFDRRQELEADQFAVHLLRRLEDRQPRACLAFVYVLALLAEQPAGSGWLASHPSPDRRAERVFAGCNGASDR